MRVSWRGHTRARWSSWLVSLAVCASVALGPEVLAAYEAPSKLSIETVRLDRTSYGPGEAIGVEVLARVEPGWHVNSHTPTYDFLIPTTLELELPPDWPAPRIEWPEPILGTFGFAEDPLSVFEGYFVIRAQIDAPSEAALASAGESLRAPIEVGYQACDDKSCVAPNAAKTTVDIALGSAGEATPPLVVPQLSAGDAKPETVPATSPASAPVGLVGMILFGVIGGLILNLMPCVLPVLSLKVFALVKAAGQGRREVTRGALATSAGILASFLALAAVAVIARQAGAAVGWGVQFQQPLFLAFLVVVILLFALNLWGLFEITLPGSLSDAADASAGRDGLAGHFASGLFATLMATPCSAPFLGTAVSFALGQPAASTFAVFTAVGAGMALPYLLLALSPGAARWLPKPGAWMETLKGVMGFLLAAAGIWLLYVLAAVVSSEALALIEVGLLCLALAVWLKRRARTSAGRIVAITLALLSVALTMVIAAKAAPAIGASSVADGPTDAGTIPWITFDEGSAQGLADDGRLVFVNVTADWCLTCKVNEKLVLTRPEVVGAFDQREVVAMKADWTRRDDTIAAYLARHGRTGIPFYVLYRPGAAPHVFGEVLTVGTVLEVLAGS